MVLPLGLDPPSRPVHRLLPGTSPPGLPSRHPAEVLPPSCSRGDPLSLSGSPVLPKPLTPFSCPYPGCHMGSVG